MTKSSPGAATRVKKAAASAQARGAAVAGRGKDWVDRQDPASHPGVAINWLQRFKLANGGLFTVLLTAYLFITALPAAIVITSYAYSDPTHLADSIGNRLGLTGSTRQLLDTVLHGAGGHQLVATLIAFFDVLFFGMGVGRVLQIAYARAWKIDLGKARLTDQARYFSTLLIPLGLFAIYTVESRTLRTPRAGSPGHWRLSGWP